ncbi:ATP-binding protein [Streptomyces sp. NPDC049577]|uniref:ATP-binding protein n=1 Tax=Streptomyces sp. NPDC049577 TaxID=3155153 RepID=UPI003440480F
MLSHIPPYVGWCLPRHPRSVARSRFLLREQARSWCLPDDAAETAVLLLSELMTNACTHGRTASPGREVSARCLLRDGRLRIEVSDPGDGVPRVRRATSEDESGRGLALVAALADAWDAQPRAHGTGKTVWCELAI